MRWGILAGLALSIGVASGCAGRLAMPSLCEGSVDAQQRQAQRFDPYPDPTLGPNVVGGRPLEYSQPREVYPLRPVPQPVYVPAPQAVPGAYPTTGYPPGGYPPAAAPLSPYPPSVYPPAAVAPGPAQ